MIIRKIKKVKITVAIVSDVHITDSDIKLATQDAHALALP